MRGRALAALTQSRAPIIGSGPIGSAPAASLWWNNGKVGGLYYNTVASPGYPVGEYVAVRAFHNEGTDFGDWGRPAALMSLLDQNTSDYSIEVCHKPSTISTLGRILSLADAVTPSLRQVVFDVSDVAGDGKAFVNVGGLSATSTGAVYVAGGVYRQTLSVVNKKASMIVNGSTAIPSFSCGSYVASSSLVIGGYPAPTYNYEGDIWLVRFRNGSGSIVAQFNANNPAHWDGGATATDSAGNPVAFTDGTPTGRTAFSWVKLSDAQAWGVLV